MLLPVCGRGAFVPQIPSTVYLCPLSVWIFGQFCAPEHCDGLCVGFRYMGPSPISIRPSVDHLGRSPRYTICHSVANGFPSEGSLLATPPPIPRG